MEVRGIMQIVIVWKWMRERRKRPPRTAGVEDPGQGTVGSKDSKLQSSAKEKQ